MDRKRFRLRPDALMLVALFGVLWLLPDVVAVLARPHDEAWARVQAAGVIHFATEASYMPFEGVGGDGVFYGLDIDVAREAARRLGVKAEFTNVGIDGLYDALRVGQADAAISALPIDPARLGKWAYSNPYFDGGLTLVTPAESHLANESDLPGRAIAVALGSDGDARLRYYQRRMAGIAAVKLDSPVEALRAVEAGRADAALLDRVTAWQSLASGFARLHIAAQLTSEPYAIAAWGESVELKAALDRALESMRADGTLERIINEWMVK
ncbi:MAG TPA: ABC transporter substrate-binding protein [Anaerolineae bacterium]